jgi:hypothetical protein
MTACILLAWLRLTALDGDLAKAEPKTLRYLLRTMQAELEGRNVVAGHGYCKSTPGPLQLGRKIGNEEKAGDRLSLVYPVSAAIGLTAKTQRPADSDLSDIPAVGCRGVHLS